jgi:glycerophosphoryl diester phosphodiesterase
MTKRILNFLKRITFFVIALLVLVSFKTKEYVVKTENLSVLTTTSIEEVLVGEPISFDIGPTNISYEFEWNFGDGTTSTLQNPSHSYMEVGNYVVTLTYKVCPKYKSVSKQIAVSLPNDICGRKTLKESLANLNNKIMVCAHRATALDTPENSLAGIQKAIDNNIEMVEIDIRLTKDGQLVLMHDASIDRTTNGSGNVSNYTLQQIKQFNLRNENGVVTNEKIPTLDEVFAMARGKVFINLDINDKAPFINVYPVVKQFGMINQVQFYTKDDTLIRSIINTNQNLVVLPYINTTSEFNAYANTNLDIVHYSDTSYNTTLIQLAKSKGWSVYANVYVNTNATPQSDNNTLLDNFIVLKGNVIQTDFPEYIKSYLQQRNLN